MQTPVYAGYEPIEDDIHTVRRREVSRLWFRAAPPAETTTGRSSPATLAATAKTLEHPGTDDLVREVLRDDRVVQATPAAAVEPIAPAEAVATTTWRIIQPGAPVLLLSTSPLLGSGRPGPILGPGMSYRITSVAGSVVGMEVMHSNGDTRSGYANAVDLRCIEPKITTGELHADEKGITSRLRLTRLASTTLGLLGS